MCAHCSDILLTCFQVENAYLKQEIQRCQTELQAINAMLVAHASCEGCKSPQEIQSHLQALGNELLSQSMALSGSLGDYHPQMNFDGLPAMPDNFFAPPAMHPPLPELKQNTPLPND
jgi:hypothetical protein